MGDILHPSEDIGLFVKSKEKAKVSLRNFHRLPDLQIL